MIPVLTTAAILLWVFGIKFWIENPTHVSVVQRNNSLIGGIGGDRRAGMDVFEDAFGHGSDLCFCIRCGRRIWGWFLALWSTHCELAHP